MSDVPDYSDQFAAAIKDYWKIKAEQKAKSKSKGKSKNKDVLAGKHMDGFERLIRAVVADAGIDLDPQPDKKIYLPGYYRETKSWDVVMQYKGHVLAVVEAKSQGSSLGNNFNNRVEEAIGQAADVWKAHERGLLVSGMRPWVGYLMIVNDTTKTTDPKNLIKGKTIPAGMQVDPHFDQMSYAERYAEAFGRLDQERMLDATCVAITKDENNHSYPNEWLSFNGFAAQLWGRCRHMQAVLG